jgi:hypothetical protein
LVAPGRISNKKYDAELLSTVTLNALTVQGVPEAYRWLELAVEESDIPMGVAVESKTPPGALGPLHECGAGQRVAHVQLIQPSEDRHDPELFWYIPPEAQAHPIVHDPTIPLPRVRSKNPAQVLLVSEDSDDAPLIPAVRKRKRAAAAKPSRKVGVMKRKRAKAAKPQGKKKNVEKKNAKKAPRGKRKRKQTDETPEFFI